MIGSSLVSKILPKPIASGKLSVKIAFVLFCLLFAIVTLFYAWFFYCTRQVDRSSYETAISQLKPGVQVSAVDKLLGPACTVISRSPESITYQCVPKGAGICSCAPVQVHLVHIKHKNNLVVSIEVDDAPGLTHGNSAN
jgi:hypothetical protein